MLEKLLFAIVKSDIRLGEHMLFYFFKIREIEVRRWNKFSKKNSFFSTETRLFVRITPPQVSFSWILEEQHRRYLESGEIESLDEIAIDSIPF